MINIDNLDSTADRAKYALALAEALEGTEEVRLGPTDQALCAKALRDRAALIDAGLA